MNEIDILVNTMKDTLASLHSNVEVEMELGSKLRQMSHLKLKNSIMANELIQERDLRNKIK